MLYLHSCTDFLKTIYREMLSKEIFQPSWSKVGVVSKEDRLKKERNTCLTWLEERSPFTKGKERLVSTLKGIRSMTIISQCLNHSRNAQLSLFHCHNLNNFHHFCDKICFLRTGLYCSGMNCNDCLNMELERLNLVSVLCSCMFLKCYESAWGCAIIP